MTRTQTNEPTAAGTPAAPVTGVRESATRAVTETGRRVRVVVEPGPVHTVAARGLGRDAGLAPRVHERQAAVDGEREVDERAFTPIR